MKKFISFALSALIFTSITTSSFAQTVPQNIDRDKIEGSLFIVGGAFNHDTEDAHAKYVELAGGTENAKIGVIGAASSRPHRNSMRVINNLISRGVPEENLVLLPLAVKDDSGTKDIDESTWIENGNNDDVVAQIKELSGIWFVGGDQTLITKVLLNDDKTPTKALEAIWEIYEKGAVIGGTSAGAAVMSEIMIAGGTSAGALLEGTTEVYESMGDQERGPLYLEEGLNFFDKGIIDQHFDRKARLGRLLYLTHLNKEIYPYGFGVDENTAMVYNPKTNTVEVFGRGGVTIVDATNAVYENGQYRGFRISYIERGDVVDLETMEIKIDENKYETVGYEYMYIENPLVSGPLTGYGTIKDILAFLVADNEAATSAKAYVYDETGRGYELVFYQDELTQGYYSTPFGGQDHYSVVNMKLDLNPVQVNIVPREVQ